MSVINQMLQDLDRRQANGASEDAVARPKQVRPVKPLAERRTAFWTALALLIIASIGWFAWVAYQLKPAPLATDLAFKAADEARTRQSTPAVAPPPSVAPVPAVTTPSEATAAEPPSPQVEMLRLAESIATPILEANRQAAPTSMSSAMEPRPTPLITPLPPKPAPSLKPAPTPVQAAAIAKQAEKPQLERRDRVGTANERAENEFRHGVSVLKIGRGGEAELLFTKALEIDSSHRGARQALIAMHLERGELEAARRLLQEGLTIDPGQPEFAIALARILVERKDLSGALAVLERSSGAAGEVPEFHVLRGTLLQRLGRHGEAADAYQTALQARSTLPQAWVGLGISLDALNRRPEAAEAFRHALAAGPVSAEVRTFVEQRIRALR